MLGHRVATLVGEATTRSQASGARVCGRRAGPARYLWNCGTTILDPPILYDYLTPLACLERIPGSLGRSSRVFHAFSTPARRAQGLLSHELCPIILQNCGRTGKCPVTVEP